MVKTVAIIDFAHSGTTMLAGICHILGVPMVFDNYRKHKLEDMDVINTLEDEEKFRKLVEERNERYGSWGFKRPGAWIYPASMALLSNPIYLAIYKDPISVTERRFGSRTRWSRKVRNTGRQMKSSIDGIYAWKQPVHFLSYHEAVLKPEKFVIKVAGAIKVDAEKDVLDKATRFIRPNRHGPRYPYAEADSWI